MGYNEQNKYQELVGGELYDRIETTEMSHLKAKDHHHTTTFVVVERDEGVCGVRRIFAVIHTNSISTYK